MIWGSLKGGYDEFMVISWREDGEFMVRLDGDLGIQWRDHGDFLVMRIGRYR